MHHRAAGEIDGLDRRTGVPYTVHQAGGAPHHVGQREINQQHPQGHEEQDGRKLHAFGDGADNQGGRDDREHQLVHREDVMRNPVGIIGVGRGGHAPEQGELGAAEKAAQKTRAETLPENKAVAKRPPENGDEPGEAEALGQHREDVLAADQAAIEKREAGQRHEEHQGGRSHHPGVVTGTREAGQAFAGIAVADICLERSDTLINRGRSLVGQHRQREERDGEKR